ncbi:hypothetical protein B0H12DRAFT_1202897 [Mycena haematopus]|nr:hypothetical protein B0H12DRAFT_1202897 [Mycena haematopus]
MTTDAAQIKSEIARLTASISQHKSNSSYINPNYKPPSNQYTRPTPPAARPPVSLPSSTNAISATSTSQVKEVVLNGVAFESSTRSLVRKDPRRPQIEAHLHRQHQHRSCATPPHTKHFPHRNGNTNQSLSRPGSCAGRGGNMTLTNSRRPYTSLSSTTDVRLRFRSRAAKRPKSDKPCPTAQCALSHDPTPERTPLCTHFLAGGTGCTRPSCPFPHVNVGPRSGVCRAFAVLGFCVLGLECPKAHVRECPDFAESGTCSRKGCSLPHVIRAAGARKLPTGGSASTATAGDKTTTSASGTKKEDAVKNKDKKEKPGVAEPDAEMGDEFISLTFNESSEDEEEGESDDESEGSESSEASDDGGDDAGGGDDSEMEGGD